VIGRKSPTNSGCDANVITFERRRAAYDGNDTAGFVRPRAFEPA
jgi:hypothetical protein